MKTERSFITINLKNLEFNFKNIQEKLYYNEKMACVVKANAYGHGDMIIAKELEGLGTDFFCVATIDEAIRLRKVLKPTTSILILGYTPYDRIDDLIKFDLIQTITSARYLHNAYKYTDKKLKVHVALDTGMSRIGLQFDEYMEKNFEFAFENYIVDGVFTHMSNADYLSHHMTEFTNNQKKKYESIYNKYKNIIPHFHYKNSASIIRRFDNLGNLVRPGIILYGLSPSSEVSSFVELKPLIEWKSVISSVREIEKGSAISYGNTFYANEDMVIATISTGYADGYSRLLSNKGYVLINGKKAPIVGRICMDQFMVDVTNIRNVESGMLATLIGKDGREEITIDEIAKICETINYEIVCSISNRVTRVYIEK